MRDGRLYLGFISDFWTSMFGDIGAFTRLLGIEAEIVYRLYLQAVAMAAPDFIDTLPLFREDFWHLIVFRDTAVEPYAVDGVIKGLRYPLPNSYTEIPFLFNKPYDPTLTLRNGVGYKLVQINGVTSLLFERTIDTAPVVGYRLAVAVAGVGGVGDLITTAMIPSLPNPIKVFYDPFYDPLMPSRDRGDHREILFFAPKVYTDERDLQQLFGYLTNIIRPTSEQYRQLIKGVLLLYTQGPVFHVMNAGLSLAAGYPVSREQDAVLAVTDTGTSWRISTTKGLAYDIPITERIPGGEIFPRLSVRAGSVLRPMSTFLEDLRVMDYLSDPEWWRGGPGSLDPELRVVRFLGPELAPQMNDLLRGRDEVIDYMFDTYLKFSVLGVKYDIRSIGNFDAIEEFFDVIWDTKPHWVGPYVQGFFKIDDLVCAPRDGWDVINDKYVTGILATQLVAGEILDCTLPSGPVWRIRYTRPTQWELLRDGLSVASWQSPTMRLGGRDYRALESYPGGDSITLDSEYGSISFRAVANEPASRASDVVAIGPAMEILDAWRKSELEHRVEIRRCPDGVSPIDPSSRTSSERDTAAYDAAEYLHHKIPRKLGGVLRLNTPPEIYEAFCRGRIELDYRPELEDRVRVAGGPCILNSRRVLGVVSDGVIRERVMVVARGDSYTWFELSWYNPAGFGSPPPP